MKKELTTTTQINQDIKTKLYSVRVFASQKVDGKRLSKYKGGIKTKAIAIQVAVEFEEYLKNYKNEALTFNQLIDLYFQDRTSKSKLEITTKISLERRVIPIVREYFGEVLANDINNKMVESFCSELRRTKCKNKETVMKKGTVQKYYRFIQAVLNYGIRKEKVQYKKVLYVEIEDDAPEDEFEPTFITPEEANDILMHIKKNFNRIYIPSLLCLLLGLRRGEALGLKWDSVDLEKGFIKIKNTITQADEIIVEKSTTKTHRARYIELSEFLINELKEHYQFTKKVTDSPYVCFTIWDTELMTPSYLSKTFIKAAAKIPNKHIKLKDLRASFGQIGKDLNAPIQGVSDVLGHADIRTTQKYYQGRSKTQQRAVVDAVSNAVFSN